MAQKFYIEFNFTVLLLVSELSLSQICSKIFPKCFWEFPKTLTYYALHASHYAVIILQYKQPWCKILLL